MDYLTGRLVQIDLSTIADEQCLGPAWIPAYGLERDRIRVGDLCGGCAVVFQKHSRGPAYQDVGPIWFPCDGEEVNAGAHTSWYDCHFGSVVFDEDRGVAYYDRVGPVGLPGNSVQLRSDRPADAN